MGGIGTPSQLVNLWVTHSTTPELLSKKYPQVYLFLSKFQLEDLFTLSRQGFPCRVTRQDLLLLRLLCCPSVVDDKSAAGQLKVESSLSSPGLENLRIQMAKQVGVPLSQALDAQLLLYSKPSL